MIPRNITREDIEKLNAVEPYCFETDREEQWYNIGLKHGLEIADENPKSPWISVEDDLPCNHEELIDKNYKDSLIKTLFVIALRDNKHQDFTCMVLVNGEWRWLGTDYTHWMVIPKLPKEQED